MLNRAIVAGISLLLLLSPSAQAHTSLVTSNPANNAVLSVSPKEIKLTFTEKLVSLSGKAINRITLQDAKAKTIALPKAQIKANTISVSLPVLTKGSYTARYRVVSGDGHPVSGTIRFRIR